MKIKLGDYFIETDERQFKVRKYIGKDKKGNDLYKSIAYCTEFTTAIKFIPQQAIRESEDISIILSKLDEIGQDIKDIDKKGSL